MRELSLPPLPGPRDQTSIDFDAEYNVVFDCETEQWCQTEHDGRHDIY